MAGVGLNIEELENAAGRVEVIAGNFEAEMASLGSVVYGGYMQDGAQVAFEAKYEEFKGTMANFVDALNAYSKAMKAYAEDMRSTTAAGTQRFDSI